jgi:hypothetical protein
MNDELSGQLTSGWRIPAYARGLLWLDSETGAALASGEYGAFTLPAPAPVLTLRWGGADGAALAQLRWQPDTLDWDGTVRVGGFVDALHTTEALDLPDAVTVLHIGGQPLKPETRPFPGIAERRRAPYPPPSFSDGVADEVDESVTTWVALVESPVLALAQDALVSKLRVYCFGSLPDDDAGWHEHFALPIALDGMTLFPP